MNEQSSMFFSVFGQIIESFVPFFNQKLSELDDLMGRSSMNHGVVFSLFKTFPRTIPIYKYSIQAICQICGINSGLFSLKIIEMLNEIIRTGNCLNFNTIKAMSHVYNADNPIHRQFYLNFIMIFLADLLLAVVREYDIASSVTEINKFFYTMASPNSIYPWICKRVINQFSCVFSKLAEKYFEPMLKPFGSIAMKGSFNDFLFQMVQYLRLDMLPNAISETFLEQIHDIIKDLMKKDLLSNTVLKSIAKLVSSVHNSNDTLQNIFNKVWSIRNNRSLKSGSFFLIVVLFSRVNGYSKQRENFLFERILSHSKDDTKIKRCIKLFHMMCFGNQLYNEWLSYEWEIEPQFSPFCFLKWNSFPKITQGEQKSFGSLFMKYFYPLSNFAICPYKFRDVLLQIASIDIDFFIGKTLSDIIFLQIDDPRVYVLVLCLPILLTEKFTENSISKVYGEHVNYMSDKLKPLIKKIVLTVNNVLPHSICNEMIEDNVKSMCQAAEEKLSSFIIEFKDEFSFLVPRPLCKVEPLIKCDDIRSIVFDSLDLVFSENEILSDEIFPVIFRSLANSNAEISKSAYRLIVRLMNKIIYQTKIGSLIVHCASKIESSELLLISIILLLKFFENYPKNLKMSIIHDIEYVAYIGFVSPYPIIRYYSNNLIVKTSEYLRNNCSISLIVSQSNQIEASVKERVIDYLRIYRNGINSNIFSSICFDNAILSTNYSLWLFFMSEIGVLLVQANYTPLFQRIKEYLPKEIIIPTNGRDYDLTFCTGLLLLHSFPYFHLDSLLLVTSKYNPVKYEPFSKIQDERTVLLELVSKFLDSKDHHINFFAFSALQHMHYTLYPLIIRILLNISNDLVSISSKSLHFILSSPYIDSEFIHSHLSIILNYLSNMIQYFILKGINGPRVIYWTKESEVNLRSNQSTIFYFCTICTIICSQMINQISEEEWSIHSREITFRFLLNWSMIEPGLNEVIRLASSKAMVDMIRIGPITNDSLLFDSKVINHLSRIESDGMPVLSFFLFFHCDMFLDLYIESCFTQSHPLSTLFFESFLMVFNANNTELLYKNSGSLLLLGLVFFHINHPRSINYLDSLIELISQLRSSDTRKQIAKMIGNIDYNQWVPNLFLYSTESLVSKAFTLLQKSDLIIQPKFIIDTIIPWIKQIKLLPNQSTCVPSIPQLDCIRLTPYQFLEVLIETTEKLDSKYISNIMYLWSTLIILPNHFDVVMLFLCSMNDYNSKKIIITHLLSSNFDVVIALLTERCTFAYYFFIVETKKSSFSRELWILPIINEAINTANDGCIETMTQILHFVLLFIEEGSYPLFSTICAQLGVEIPSNLDQLPPKLLEIIISLIKKISEQSERGLNIWGNEALKWIFGSRNIRVSYISLLVFNHIQCPKSTEILNGISSSVLYHIENSSSDSSYFSLFIIESFKLFNSLFMGNELFSFQFALSFVDCPNFSDSCLTSSIQLFLKSLSCKDTISLAWGSIISIVRPIFSTIEKDESYQKILDLLIKSSGNEELMMIALPFTDVYPNMFPSCFSKKKMYEVANDTSLCQAIGHYSMISKDVSNKVLDNIFQISIFIIKKIKIDHVSSSLAMLYQKAISSVSFCPHSVRYIIEVVTKDPLIPTKLGYHFFEWSRSLEDVVRSLKRLIRPLPDPPASTDFKDCSSVLGCLTNITIPSIIPFAAQQEMLIMMKNVFYHEKPRRSHPKKGSLTMSSSVGSPLKSMSYFPISNDCDQRDINPLKAPQELLEDPKCFETSLHVSSFDIWSYNL